MENILRKNSWVSFNHTNKQGKTNQSNGFFEGEKVVT